MVELLVVDLCTGVHCGCWRARTCTLQASCMLHVYDALKSRPHVEHTATQNARGKRRGLLEAPPNVL